MVLALVLGGSEVDGLGCGRVLEVLYVAKVLVRLMVGGSVVLG